MESEFTKRWRIAGEIRRLLSEIENWESTDEARRIGSLLKELLDDVGTRNQVMNIAWHDFGGDFNVVEDMFRNWPTERQDLFIEQFSTMLVCVLQTLRMNGPRRE